jgi:hypothetical protein
MAQATKVYKNQLRPAHAVYQGTASAVPQEGVSYLGFSPCSVRGFSTLPFVSN